jgi:hypothetical protein
VQVDLASGSREQMHDALPVTNATLSDSFVKSNVPDGTRGFQCRCMSPDAKMKLGYNRGVALGWHWHFQRGKGWSIGGLFDRDLHTTRKIQCAFSLEGTRRVTNGTLSGSWHTRHRLQSTAL